jgi:hypothetical protein
MPILLTEWRIKHRCITLENIKFVNHEKIKNDYRNCTDYGLFSRHVKVKWMTYKENNTNAANSTTANNLETYSMYDGSFDLMILLMELLFFHCIASHR